MSDQSIIIVGAGVAGLSLAIMLTERGIQCLVLESRERFDEGYTSGVRISAEGVHILSTMKIPPIGEEAKRVIMQCGFITAGFDCAPNPTGSSAIVVTRLALHEKLLARADELNLRIKTGFKVASISESMDGVEVSSSVGEVVKGRYVIGADGVGSVIRKLLNPGKSSSKTYAGYLGLGFITESKDKVDMTVHKYPGQHVGIASCGKERRAQLFQQQQGQRFRVDSFSYVRTSCATNDPRHGD
jgi:2-polyprenyl-6-methoxyphenol hydroxylase-like FAD-dependent oxidoreductase